MTCTICKTSAAPHELHDERCFKCICEERDHLKNVLFRVLKKAGHLEPDINEALTVALTNSHTKAEDETQNLA